VEEKQVSFCSEYQKYFQLVGKSQKDSPAKQILTVGIYGSAKVLSIIPEIKFFQTYSAINTRKVPLPEVPVI